jgi:ADP-heptose:LPS heptosyltransferase
MKILVISLAGIGDTLIATPLIRELRAAFPDAILHAFVFWPGAKDLLEDNPHLDAVHQLNLVKVPKPSALRFLLHLRRERYDISINTHPQSRMAYRAVARIIGARLRLSHLYDNSNLLDRLLVNRAIPQDYTIHGIENNLRLLRLLGRAPILSPPQFEVFLTPAEEQAAEGFIQQHALAGRKRLGIHVGSGGTKNLRLKRWPFRNYLELIQRLNRDLPQAAVLLFGGPEEQAEHDEIRRVAAGHPVFAPDTKNLRQAAALIKRCDAFLSVDTALMHLAAAMKVPSQIVIEAPTLNATNVPYQQAFTLVPNPAVNGRNLEYYRYDGRGIQGTAEALTRCMASVTVDAVFEAVLQALR